MKVTIVISLKVFEVRSCYALLFGRVDSEKEEIFELIDRVVVVDKVLIGINFNSHLGRDLYEVDEFHYGYGLEK